MVNVNLNTHRLKLITIVGGVLFAASIFACDTLAQGKGKPKKVNPGAVFTANCARCHGADGKGTALGQSLETPDLTDADLQKNMSPRKYAASFSMATAQCPPSKQNCQPPKSPR